MATADTSTEQTAARQAEPRYNKPMSPLRDLMRGVGMMPVWGRLAWRDYERQYAGTILGPLWLTFGNVLFVFGIAYLFANWSQTPFQTYIGHVALGFALWTLMSRTLSECTRCLNAARPMIQEIPLPLSLHVLRTLARLFIAFAVDMLPMIFFLFYYQVPLAEDWWLGLAGLGLVALALPGYGFLMAALGTALRSFQPLMELILRFTFFFTPIIWILDDNRISLPFAEYNPFTLALIVSRDAVLYGAPTLEDWQFAGTVCALGWGGGLVAFIALYRRLPLFAVRA